MTAKSMRTMLAIALLNASAAAAEDLLVKDSGNYLGRKVSAKTFETCSGGSIEIGTGTVRSTERRCKTAPIVLGPVRLQAVDQSRNRVTVKDDFGTQIQFTLKPEEMSNQNLRVGMTLKISGATIETRAFEAVSPSFATGQ